MESDHSEFLYVIIPYAFQYFEKRTEDLNKMQTLEHRTVSIASRGNVGSGFSSQYFHQPINP